VGDLQAAARIALLWPLTPSVALMNPFLDQMLALFVLCSAACLVAAYLAPTPRSRWQWAALAGILTGASAFFNYATPVDVVVVSVALLGLGLKSPGGPRRVAQVLLVAAGVAVVALFLPYLAGYDVLASLRVASETHIPLESKRSYTTWLLFGPWDLILFLGLPVALLWLGGFARSAVKLLGRRRLHQADWLRLLSVGTVAAFLLTGLSRAELGRIAMPLMPLGLLAGLSGTEDESPPGPGIGLAVLVGGLLTILGIVLRLQWRLP
jgi:hypothetical protein